MNVSDARSAVTTSLDQLANELERGKSDALVAFLQAMSRFHRYFWGNTMLLLSQCPHATHVAGYRQWNRLSRYVRKGEKGLTILTPIMVPKKDGGAASKGRGREGAAVQGGQGLWHQPDRR